MVGFRYNAEIRQMELCGYFHDDGARYFSDVLGAAAIGEEIVGDIEIDYGGKMAFVTINDGGHVTTSAQTYSGSRKWCRTVSGWFGGTEKPPHRIGYTIWFEIE